jgi:hypothetical protein
MHDVRDQIKVILGSQSGAAPTTLLPSVVSSAPARSRVRLVVAAVALLTVGFLVMLAAKPGGSDVAVRISDVATAAAAVAATVTCAIAGRRHASSLRTFWWLLAAACGAWAGGEAMWAWYEVVLRVQVPTPSWADAGYLAAPLLAVAAFACHPATRERSHRRVIPILDAVAVASAVLFVSWTLVLGPLWSHAGGLSVGALVAVAYPFGDVVILVLVVLALRDLQPGSPATAALLLGGLACMAVSDSVYTYLTQIHGYSSGDLIDTGWFAAYLAIAGAALVSESPVDRARSRALPSPLLSVVAPYLPILVALVAVPVQVSRGARLDRVEWGIAMCLVVVVLVRQVFDVLRRSTSFRPAARESVRPAPSGRRHIGRPASPAITLSADTRAQAHALTLQMVAATRSTAQERAQRISNSTLMVLMPLAGVLALWDLSLLVRGAA